MANKSIFVTFSMYLMSEVFCDAANIVHINNAQQKLEAEH